MPVWLSAPLIVIAVIAVVWWADMRLSVIIDELQAIRENLDRLRGLAEEEVVAESEDVTIEG